MNTASERVARWRKRAEECRTLAEIVKTPTVQTDYLGLARTYDFLADNAYTVPVAVPKARIPGLVISRSPARANSLSQWAEPRQSV